jgi:hypothetical protein
MPGVLNMTFINLFGQEQKTSLEESEDIINHPIFRDFVNKILESPDERHDCPYFGYDALIQWWPSGHYRKLDIEHANPRMLGRPFPASISDRVEKFINAQLKARTGRDSENS